MQPYVLLWLRYTAFIGLYPLGVGSELAMVALALPTIRAQRPWSVQVRRTPGCDGAGLAVGCRWLHVGAASAQ